MENNSRPTITTCKHYSKDLKKRVVYQRLTLGFTMTEIAKNLNMSPQVVHVVKDPQTYAKQGHARLLDTDSVEFLLALLEQHSDIYLDGLAERLMDQKNLERSLKLLGITSKKLSKATAECCEESRNQFQFLIS
ncbi:hypothetical protein M422DRAFT_53270 [Sphaerobolus stellatus SS14]|uniref:Uncharacterized protein n=1 Tax=Sphaerobolus stellatus (strain SS14) TaxID=990650 RepID=A0A0C9V2B5_SPHS4|nr:hypothetical protein M422DRAFT_53270 [Sphaerobolus stellatus SS14]